MNLKHGNKDLPTSGTRKSYDEPMHPDRATCTPEQMMGSSSFEMAKGLAAGGRVDQEGELDFNSRDTSDLLSHGESDELPGSGASDREVSVGGCEDASFLSWSMEGCSHLPLFTHLPPHSLSPDPNGDVYIGQIREGKRHGYGEYKSETGNQYAGQWREGMRHGRGEGRRRIGFSSPRSIFEPFLSCLGPMQANCI